jgi:hypothetical protein
MSRSIAGVAARMFMSDQQQQVPRLALRCGIAQSHRGGKSGRPN